ncbi:MAG: FxsA family protein, partial [Deltaproteobacteria bacterium]|nr:FxsA family protein [Deltaproteobacteria bacterium]
MFARLLLLFTVVPLVELYLLIEVGSVIGGLNTILLVLGTGALGAFLARLEGLRTLGQIQRNLNQGIVPAEEMVDGVIILVAGLLLITPGILTDAC